MRYLPPEHLLKKISETNGSISYSRRRINVSHFHKTCTLSIRRQLRVTFPFLNTRVDMLFSGGIRTDLGLYIQGKK